MFTKTAIALAIVLSTATGTLAASKKQSTDPASNVYQSQTMYNQYLYDLSAKIHRDTYMHD
jgi:hypothetical protein